MATIIMKQYLSDMVHAAVFMPFHRKPVLDSCFTSFEFILELQLQIHRVTRSSEAEVP